MASPPVPPVSTSAAAVRRLLARVPELSGLVESGELSPRRDPVVPCVDLSHPDPEVLESVRQTLSGHGYLTRRWTGSVSATSAAFRQRLKPMGWS